MWIDKLSDGVVRIVTPLGPRYIKPTFKQRAYFLWLFRHFDVLPVQVLSERQRRLIDSLCADSDFASQAPVWEDVVLLGTIERRSPVETTPPRRPSARVEQEVPGGLRQRS